MLKKISLMFFFSVLLSSFAHSMFIFSPSITYLTQKQNDGTNPESNAKLTLIDLRLGHVMDFGLYLGGLYSIHDHNTVANSSDSYFGPSIGYYNSGFFVVGTFYVFGERDLTNGTGKYTDVSGYQVDISYSVPVAEGILVGPQLTLHNIEFSDFQIAGSSNPTSYSFSSVSPYFNVTFLF